MHGPVTTPFSSNLWTVYESGDQEFHTRDLVAVVVVDPWTIFTFNNPEQGRISVSEPSTTTHTPPPKLSGESPKVVYELKLLVTQAVVDLVREPKIPTVPGETVWPLHVSKGSHYKSLYILMFPLVNMTLYQ